ncbi:MAG: hypothetical protein AB9882_12010 [Ignavibacteriaceae bacterium]
MKRIVTTLFLFLVLLGSNNAQSDWLSTLFVVPTPSPYLSDWQNNPTLGNFTLTYNGSSPVSFIFAVKITSAQYGELASVRSSQIDWPAGPNTQVYTPYDVLSWNDAQGLTFNNAMKERIVRSGRFPEGDYTLEILVKSMQGAVLHSASANFSIIYPEPPQLILPQNTEVVTMPQPFFQWSIINVPLTMPVTYKIKIVERLAGQNLSQALAANPVHHLDSVIGIGLYNYPMSGFPFQNGKEYIWQISATDDQGNVMTSNNGKSEIWSFYYGSSPSQHGLPFDTLTIVDGVAYLINLKSLTITEDMNSYTINGTTSLILIVGGSEKVVSVDINDLMIQKGAYTPPMILGGSFSANISPNVLTLGDYFKATNIAYSMMDGLTLGGSLKLPGISALIPLIGKLTIGPMGISGSLSVEKPAADALYSLGGGLAGLLINKATIHFSEPVVKLGGVLQLFGVNSNCNIDDLSISPTGAVNGSFTCNLNTPVSLVPGSNRLELTFNSISGDFTANVISKDFSYNLRANAGLDFRATDSTNYGADLVVGLSNSGFNLISFTPRGTVTPPAIDLGWIKLAMSNLNLSQLSYSEGNWNFAMGMDIRIIFPSFNNLTLPLIQGASLGKSGLTIPAINLTSLNLAQFTFETFNFEMLNARMSSVTIPFFTGGAGATTGMNFSFDFKMRMPNFPNSSLANQVYNINNATFNNGVFSATIPPQTFSAPGIILPLSPAVTFLIRELSGSISADFSGASPSVNPDIKVRGSLTLPPLFNCSSGGGTLDLMTTTLKINGNGGLIGRMENITPACSVSVAPLTLFFPNVAVDFNLDVNQQRINFEGSVNARLPKPGGGVIEGSGSVNYEIISNTIVSLNVQINDPVSFSLPSTTPVFAFQVPGVTITKESLLIDGRGYLALAGGTNIGVTFRSFNLRWMDFKISSGDVIFDIPFAFKVTLDGSNLDFKTVPANSSFTEQTGIMLNLPASFSLGATGFKAEGNSTAHLRFQGTDLSSLTSTFSNDFAMFLNSFKVGAGQIEFFSQNKRVALINSSGFFPDIGYFASSLLPEKIPLPVESVGYLKIKEGDTFLIDYTSETNGVRLKTKPGQPVKLFLPALKLTRPTNPELDVTFDIVVNSQNLQLISGSIEVAVPSDQLANWDLTSYGIPFIITNVLYGELSGGVGFQLRGKVKTFGTEFSDPVNLTIFGDGRLTGDINFNINKNIPLVSGSDKLNLNITKVAGSFDIPLTPFNLNFNLNLTGGIKLNLGSGTTYGANATFVVSRTGISVENFMVQTPSQTPKLDFTWLNLALSNFTLPKLVYDPLSGWDFEVGLSAVLNFPNISYDLPAINGITIKKNGITIPAISIPEIITTYRTVFGFAIKPLAFRMQQFSFNWFTATTPPANWGFKFDFEVSFSQMPAALPEAVKNINIRVLNAGFSNGKITGDIQTKNFTAPGVQLALGGTTNFLIKQISGTLSPGSGNQSYHINLGGDIQLPEFLRCGGNTGVTPIVGTTLKIDSEGRLSGTVNNFVPKCPLDLGIGNLIISNSSLEFSLNGENQNLIMDLTGNLRLPAPTQGDSISATGNLKFDLLTGKMIDGQIAINTPFRFNLPQENSVLNFTINSAVFNKDGLKINGSNSLILGSGTTINTTFNNFLFDHNTLTVLSGTASFQNQFALKFVVQSGGLKWSAIPTTATITEETAARLSLPSNITLGASGISTSGETTVLVRVGGREYANIRCVFSNDFSISYTPFKVSKGEAKFYLGTTLAGVLNSNGFVPGDILGMIPLPEKLPLPDTTIAYLVLKQGNTVLVETQTVANGLRISSKTNQKVKLVIPGMKLGGIQSREVMISFSIVVNPSTFALVEGSISASATGDGSLISFSNIGLPLDITRLDYEKMGGQPKLRLAARLNLPSSISAASVTMDSLIVSSQGIVGTITAGKYEIHHPNNETYIASVNLGSYATFKIGGISAVLRSNSINIRLSGDILTAIFKDDNNQFTPLHYIAQLQNGSFNFTFDMAHVQNSWIPMKIASFKPQAIGSNPAFSLDLSANNFILTLSGLLKIPSLDDQFIVSFSGLRISKDGITVPDVSMTTSSQQFDLFGARFALRNLSNSEKAISFAYTNGVLFMTFNGDITFFGNTVQFRGLKIGSNGSLSINQANLLTGQFYIVQNRLGISKLSIGTAGMRVDGFIKLPQPADTTRKSFYFTINSQGEVTGGADVTIIDETPGIGGNDQTEWDFWIAKFDVTYARLKLNLANFRQSTFEVISDLYFLNDVNKYIRVGYKQGGTPRPGFKIDFNGNVEWGNIQVASNLANIDLHALKLNITQAGIINPTEGKLQLQLSGKLSIGLEGVSGSLNFNNLRISPNGAMENLGQSVTGGSFSIVNVVTVTVNDINFGSGFKTIWIKGGQLPGGSTGGTVDSQEVKVERYFSFGATISIPGIASGGVQEFLMYKTGNTSHLTIRNANLDIQGVVKFRADLVYTKSGNNFYLLFGGSGRIINKYKVMVIGKVGQRSGQTSFGVFVAVSGLSITIPPAIVLTGLGGGFFYNPDPADLQLVKNVCGLDASSKGKIVANPGKFAVLVYAQAAIISNTMASGKVLLTVTQNYFELYGELVLLNQASYFKGTLYLYVGFTNSTAIGTIGINVNVSPLVTGNAELSIYFFPNNIWGVDGRLNLTVLNIITCNAEFFVGNPGFYVSMSAGISIDIWILKVEAGMGITIWKIRNSSWGAYGYAYIRAYICGINITSLSFKAGMINGGHSLIYGEAAWETWIYDFKFWGAINDGHTSGGYGSNSGYLQQIQNAVAQASNMRNQKDEALQQINNLR